MIDAHDVDPMPEVPATIETVEPTDDEPTDEPADDESTADETAARILLPSPDAPYDVAKRLYRLLTRDGLRVLLAWRGGWMRWDRTHWTEVDEAEIRGHVYEVLGHADYMKPVKKDGVTSFERTHWNPNRRKTADVMEAMEAIGHLSRDIDPPAWIVHSADAREALISCANGLLDLTTRELVEHTPALFNLVSVPFDYDAKAAKPEAWLKFLKSVWGDDKESIALLQEYFGYVLSGRTDMQKMLLLIGPTRSGKGTIARLLTALIGKGHVCGPTLASLGTNFGMSSLLGKPLAIISDARLGNMPSHTVVERLLSITGEDMIDVDRKFRDPWSGKLPTRLVILTNELPKFRDSSGAIANRMLILRMTNSFLGREDRTLDKQLAAELPGILNWALASLKRLNENSKFTVPKSSEDAVNLMMDLASPMSAFVRECMSREVDDEVSRDDAYHAWKVWAEDNGHVAGAKSTFGRDLRAVVPELRDFKKWADVDMGFGVTTRKLTRCYGHIGLSGASPASDGETAGHGVDGEAGHPASGPDSDFGRFGEAGRETGHPASNGQVKPQVSNGEAGEAGKSPLSAQVNGHRQAKPCPSCGYHVVANGVHADRCIAKVRA